MVECSAGYCLIQNRYPSAAFQELSTVSVCALVRPLKEKLLGVFPALF